MSPKEFEGLKRSEQMKTVLAELAAKAESLRFRRESVLCFWTEEASGEYRALLAAVGIIEMMIAEGVQRTLRGEDLPKWLAAMIRQMVAVYVTPLPKPEKQEEAA